MSNYIFTAHGSNWAAKALCGCYSPIDSVYVIYSKSNVHPDIPSNIDVSYIETSLPSGYGYIKISNGITSFPQSGGKAVYTILISDVDIPKSCYLVSAALVGDGSVILAADITSGLKWIPGATVSVNIPIVIPSYTQE